MALPTYFFIKHTSFTTPGNRMAFKALPPSGGVVALVHS